MPGPLLLVDLRVAQVHRERGIPRYSQSLVLTLAQDFPRLKIACLVDPDRDPPLRLDELARHCRILNGADSIHSEGGEITHFLQAGLFEAHSPVRTLFPVELGVHRPRLGAIVYDLIPWLFPDAYLSTAADARDYLSIVPAISRLDRVFAISESVRRDVIAIANAEPTRVVTIHGGLDEQRWPMLSTDRATGESSHTPRNPSMRTSRSGQACRPASIDVRNASGATFEVTLPFWLYVGGDDFRKNLPRLLEAIAILKRRGRLDGPLVVACSIGNGRRGELMARAASLGLRPGADVVLTGYVSDDTLGDLFASCMATVFPSIYEGLGLPVLESYAFGKPVLAADTSAIKELVPERCRFDPYDAVSIADAMLRFRDDPQVAHDSLAFAPRAIALHQWSTAAHELSKWLEDGDGRQSRAATAPLWVASSLPPDASGVAFYTQKSLAAPTAGPVTFFAPVKGTAGMEAARISLARARHDVQSEADPAEVLSLATLTEARLVASQDSVVFVLGNSHHHLATIRHLLAQGAGSRDAVHLHDVFIRGLLALYFGSEQDLTAGLLGAYPVALVNDWIGAGGDIHGVTNTLLGPRLLVRRAGVRHFVVNSTAAADLLRADLGDDAAGVRIDVAFLPILDPFVQPRDRDAVKLRIGHFGILGRAKHPDRVVAACDLLSSKRQVELIFAGYGVLAYLQRNNLTRRYMRIIESPSDHRLQEAMSAVDCAVQLRYPDQGESSGVVNQLLALRRPVICARIGSFVDLDAAAHLVDPHIEPADLAAAIEDAASAGWPAGGDALVAQRSAQVFEARLREILGLGAIAKSIPQPEGERST